MGTTEMSEETVEYIRKGLMRNIQKRRGAYKCAENKVTRPNPPENIEYWKRDLKYQREQLTIARRVLREFNGAFPQKGEGTNEI